jgi:hypothetical protein
MKTILVGYKDERGTGPSVILSGPEVSANEQVSTLNAAKASGKYPEGIVRIELRPVLEPRMVAIKVKPAPTQAANSSGDFRPPEQPKGKGKQGESSK